MPVVAVSLPRRPTARLESSLRLALLHKTFHTLLNHLFQVLKYIIEVCTSTRFQQALS